MIRFIFKWLFRLVLLALTLAFLFVFVSYWRSTNDCGKTAAPTNPVKAIVYCDYGTSEVLKLEEIEKPVPNDNQVLIKVRAASVNPYDWHFMRGTPYIMRAMGTGLRKPKATRLGVDVAGTVEAVGKNITQFKPGDEVFGGKTGAFAEYVCGSERGLAIKPPNMTFEQAATLNIAGLTALQAVRDKAQIRPGQKVLINGASGGVGTFAVQIAKSFGAEVTGVCSGRNADMVRSLGADHVIDYTKEDFAKSSTRYDAMLDNVPNHSLSECRRILTPNGKYVLIGGGGPNDGKWIGPFVRVIQAALLSKFIDQKMGMMMAEVKKDDLATLAEMVESGKMKPVIDRTYKLSELAKAVDYVEEGHARGKVVITIDES
jgi:NADPH:quinone reductase-like Zn-dependent oxidoreductase